MIRVLSLVDALAFCPTAPTIAVRIHDPYPAGVEAWSRDADGRRWPRNTPAHSLADSPHWVRMLAYSFDDIDLELRRASEALLIDPSQEDGFEDRSQERPITEAIAEAMVRDFAEAYRGGEDVIFHCTGGVSRSPATALAFNALFDLGADRGELLRGHPAYNRSVYRALIEAGARLGIDKKR